MNFDCELSFQNIRFRYRAGGLITRAGKILLVKSNTGNYYYFIGGGVHVGETSEECIIRELQEEVGLELDSCRLVAICENYYNIRNNDTKCMKCHSLEFYYHSVIDDGTSIKSQTDLEEQLIWVPLNELCHYNIKPHTIVEHIDRILDENSVVHLVDRSDLNASLIGIVK